MRYVLSSLLFFTLQVAATNKNNYNYVQSKQITEAAQKAQQASVKEYEQYYCSHSETNRSSVQIILIEYHYKEKPPAGALICETQLKVGNQKPVIYSYAHNTPSFCRDNQTNKLDSFNEAISQYSHNGYTCYKEEQKQLKIQQETNNITPVTKKNSAASKPITCVDHHRLFKHCSDQNQLFEMAKTKALTTNKDILLIYGHDTCCWCSAIVNFFHFSGKGKKLQKHFILRTVLKSEDNPTGRELLTKLLPSNENIKYIYRHIIPYLVRIDGKTGAIKDSIDVSVLEPYVNADGHCEQNLDLLTKRLLKQN